MKTLHVGDVVMYINQHRQEQPALVTEVHGETEWEDEFHPDNAPSINLVTLDPNEGARDSFGRQRKAETSVVHQENQSAGGFCWRLLTPNDL